MDRSKPSLRLALAAVLALPAAASLASMALAAPPSPGAPRAIELAVDATDAPRGVFHSRLVVPAAPGPLTLAYPKWVQGEHAP